MKKTRRTEPRGHKWLYPVIYLLFVLISAIPPYAELPYAPQDSQDVIINLLMVSVHPYEHMAPLFHLATLLIVVLIGRFPEKMGRVLAAYMGLNYLVIAVLPTMATTEKYGYVIHWGALVASALLGVTWIMVAVRSEPHTSFENVPPFRYLLLPLALLAFWSPYRAIGVGVRPDFDPLLLLTSPDYGLTFCLTSPVFLFLLVLFYPKVSPFAYRITAFNGLLYGLLNMTHFCEPELRWMGVLHLPLLIIASYALMLPGMMRRRAARAG